MLRRVLLGVTLFVSVAGAIAVMCGEGRALPAAVWGAALALAILVERWRYRSRPALDAEQWQTTGERFIDPESGKLVEVLYCAQSGARRYVAVDRDGGQP